MPGVVAGADRALDSTSVNSGRLALTGRVLAHLLSVLLFEYSTLNEGCRLDNTRSVDFLYIHLVPLFQVVFVTQWDSGLLKRVKATVSAHWGQAAKTKFRVLNFTGDGFV